MKKNKIPTWFIALIILAVLFLILAVLLIVQADPEPSLPSAPTATLPQATLTPSESPSAIPHTPTSAASPTEVPPTPTAIPTATLPQAAPTQSAVPPTAALTVQEAVPALPSTQKPFETIILPTDYGQMPEMAMNTLLGDPPTSKALLNRMQSRGRQADLVGFATWYYQPYGMNAYRTIYDQNTCYVAVHSDLANDTSVGMHLALVVVDRPTESPPFMAYVGDIGPFGNIQMAFTDRGQTIEVTSGGEPLVIDVPVGCFTSYINSDRKTSHVSVYLLTAEETLEYLEMKPLMRP